MNFALLDGSTQKVILVWHRHSHQCDHVPICVELFVKVCFFF